MADLPHAVLPPKQQSSGNGPVDEVIIGMLGIVRGLIRKYPELKSECTKDKYARPLHHSVQVYCPLYAVLIPSCAYGRGAGADLWAKCLSSVSLPCPRRRSTDPPRLPSARLSNLAQRRSRSSLNWCAFQDWLWPVDIARACLLPLTWHWRCASRQAKDNEECFRELVALLNSQLNKGAHPHPVPIFTLPRTWASPPPPSPS